MKGFLTRVPSYLFLIFSAIILSTSCDSQRVFEDKKDFESKYWVFNDPAEFEFEIAEPEQKYNLSVNIRNSSKYPYQNIYLQYYLEDSTGRLVSSELKNILLFNPITGVPLGKGLGDINDIQKTFLENFTFENSGKYKLRIDQFMRQDSLPDILSVGLRVEVAGE
jgi:gliding motility-associated lipoprotein GldH